jgi:hypothetical protein
MLRNSSARPDESRSHAETNRVMIPTEGHAVVGMPCREDGAAIPSDQHFQSAAAPLQSIVPE